MMHNWIDKVVKIIVDYYDPDQIILFGSYAKNKQTLQSDIDLLIVKETTLPRFYRGGEISNYLHRYPVKFDLLFYTPGELEQKMALKYSFIDSILKNGILLYKKT